jgi:hypothetical protein
MSVILSDVAYEMRHTLWHYSEKLNPQNRHSFLKKFQDYFSCMEVEVITDVVTY